MPFKFKVSSDGIQAGILIAAILAAVGSLFSWVDSRYAKASEVSVMQQEIHQIYGKIIPVSEQHQ